MLGSTRSRFFLALYALVAISGALLTHLPQTSDSISGGKAEVAPLAPASRAPAPAAAAAPLPSAPKLAPQLRAVPPAGREASAPAAVDARAAIIIPDFSGAESNLLIVKPGESLGSISFRYLQKTIFMTTGEFEAAIRQSNPALAGARLRPGQEIVIPGIEPGPIVERPRPLPKDAEVRAIYLTGWTAGSERGISLIRRWKAAGGNAICFDIKDYDGLLSVSFEHPLAPRRSPLIRNLPKFVRFMHQQDMHVIARIALFRDEHIAKNHPRLSVRSRSTQAPWRENGKQVWTDPSLREVQDYNLALARRVAAAGVDEIQFDYVRFPAEGNQDDTMFQFQAEAGEAQPAGDPGNPAAAQAPPRSTRSRVINEFLRRAHAELRPTGVLLSLDVFGVMAWERSVDLARTGQNIAEMARHCDVLSPMIYPSHFFGMDGFERPGDAPEHFIGRSMDRFRQITAGSGVVLRPWLQAFAWRTPSYSPDYVITQVAVSNQKGGVGYLFWNANNDYSKPFAAMPALMAMTRRRETETGKVKETAAIHEIPLADRNISGSGDEQPNVPASEIPPAEVKANF